MPSYNFPETNFEETKRKAFAALKSRIFLAGIILFSAGLILGVLGLNFLVPQNLLQPPADEIVQKTGPYVSDISYEQAIIDAVRDVSPSVVSIIISKDLPQFEQRWINPFGDMGPFGFEVPEYVQKGTQYREVGQGSGFIISEDGMVLTNKHVVVDDKADYVVFTNDGQEFEAEVLARDPVQDLAVIKIKAGDGQALPKFNPLILGDSDGIQIGQTAIAIGNALGRFQNTVSVGVISGLGRTISASSESGSFSEVLEDIIQTDAAINSGNSGGPLLNLKGEVIGINTAMAQGAEAIGFAIPVNKAKRAVDQVKQNNKITYPFLGIRYVLINNAVKKEENLSVDYGVLILPGDNGEVAVTPGSAAAKAGIKENDIILELNGRKITKNNSLAKMIQEFKPGDQVSLKILRNGTEINIDVVLGERS